MGVIKLQCHLKKNNAILGPTHKPLQALSFCFFWRWIPEMRFWTWDLYLERWGENHGFQNLTSAYKRNGLFLFGGSTRDLLLMEEILHLLMEEILHHLGCIPNPVKNGIIYQPQLVSESRISEASTVGVVFQLQTLHGMIFGWGHPYE